jgi:hypothetical protein
MTVGADQTRFNGMLEQFQQQDASIDNIVVHSKFVVAYLLQQDGPNPGWRKANIEGPVYLVRRRAKPRYQLIVKNQFNNNDLLDSLHPDWELDCQKSYVFYKVEDTSKRIRGLWFHDDNERQRIEKTLEMVLDEIRNQPSTEPQMEPQPIKRQPIAAMAAMQQGLQGEIAPPGMGMGLAPPPAEETTITMSSLRTALHALADDQKFLMFVMQKLKDAQPGAGGTQ